MTGRYAEAIPVARRLPRHATPPIRRCCWPRSSRSTSCSAAGRCSRTVDARSCGSTSIAYKGTRPGAAREVPRDDASSVTGSGRCSGTGATTRGRLDGTTVFYGLDFGANVWGSHLGVSTRRDAVARDFARMAALGFTVARWFVFGDGRSGIVYDDRGLPTGLDPHLFADLDAALEIARDAGDPARSRAARSPLDVRGRPRDDCRSGDRRALRGALPDGRADVLHSPKRPRVAVRARVRAAGAPLRPGAASAPISPRSIFAFEFMNEPDFVIEEWERDLQLARAAAAAVRGAGGAGRAVERAGPRAYERADDARRRPAPQPVGVGRSRAGARRAAGALLSRPEASGARRRHLRHAGARHWACARGSCSESFPATAPERHPAGASPPRTTLDEYLEFAVDAGYAGAWPWSFSGTDDYGPLPRDAAARVREAASGAREPAVSGDGYSVTSRHDCMRFDSPRFAISWLVCSRRQSHARRSWRRWSCCGGRSARAAG